MGNSSSESNKSRNEIITSGNYNFEIVNKSDNNIKITFPVTLNEEIGKRRSTIKVHYSKSILINDINILDKKYKDCELIGNLFYTGFGTCELKIENCLRIRNRLPHEIEII